MSSIPIESKINARQYVRDVNYIIAEYNLYPDYFIADVGAANANQNLNPAAYANTPVSMMQFIILSQALKDTLGTVSTLQTQLATLQAEVATLRAPPVKAAAAVPNAAMPNAAMPNAAMPNAAMPNAAMPNQP